MNVIINNYITITKYTVQYKRCTQYLQSQRPYETPIISKKMCGYLQCSIFNIAGGEVYSM